MTDQVLIRKYLDITQWYNVENEFYSVKEVAVIFAVNELTIRRAIRKGWIKAIKIGEGKRSPYRISRKCIDNIHFFCIDNKSY